MALNSIVDISTPHLSGLKERKMEELLSCVCCIFLLVLVMAASIKVLLQRNILRRNTREKRWKFVYFFGGGVSFQFDKGKKMKRRNQMASKGNAAADGLN